MSEIQIDKSGEIVLTNPNMGGYHTFPGYWLDDLPPSMEGHNVLQLRVGRIYRVYPDPDPYPEGIPLPEPNPYRDYPTQYTQGEIPWRFAASLLWYNNAAWVKPNEDRETWTPIGNPNDASREITTTRDDAQTIIAQTIPSACFLPCGETQWHTRYAEADIARTQDTRRDLWRNAYIDGDRIKESLAVSKAAFADLLSQIQSANAVEQDAPLNWTNYGQKEIHAFRDPLIGITDSSDTVEIVRLEVRHHVGQSDTNPAAIGANLDVSVPETITLTVHVWRRGSDIVFRLGDKVFAIESTPKAKILLTDDRRNAIWEAINERNVNADLPDPRPDAPDRMYRTYHTHEIDDLAMLTGPFREIIGWETLALDLPIVTSMSADRSTTLTPYPVRNLPINMYTGQEFGALSSAMRDGRSGNGWINDPQENARTYEGNNFLVKLSADRDEGTITWLETLTGKQDIDGFLATCAIASALIQEIDRDPVQKITGLRFDLAEIGKKIGFDPRTTIETRELREKIFAWFSFLTRAQVIGERSVPYYDKTTKQKIDTRIEAPMLQILEKQQPIQPGLFGDAPMTILVALSPAWRNILCNPDLQQYLPYAERIAAIPPKQPGCAWARSIGMSLLDFWRRNVGKTIMPTRRELLKLTPTQAPPKDILEGEHPKRAVEYWCKAMGELVDKNIIADTGEAKRTQADQLKDLPRKDWTNAWLDEQIDIQPATDMQIALNAIAKNKYLPRPKDLTTPKNKGGRPKKIVTE